MVTAMRAAFYKGTRPGIAGLYNRLVRSWTRSRYSHVELVFDDGVAASSSFADGGVRFKEIAFDSTRWDLVDLPPGLAPAARAWFDAHCGQRYDLLGNLHFVLAPVGDDKEKWFCSESVAAALGLPDAWRFDPGTLHAVLACVAEKVSFLPSNETSPTGNWRSRAPQPSLINETLPG